MFAGQSQGRSIGRGREYEHDDELSAYPAGSACYADIVNSAGDRGRRLSSLWFPSCGSNLQAAMHKYMSCTLWRLSSSEPVAVVRVSTGLSRLHPLRLYWFRTRIVGMSLL